MKFLLNENFPMASVRKLLSAGLDVRSISIDFPSITDEEVMNLAINENRTILTFDRDYGTLIYRSGYRPAAGVIYFRIFNFQPEEPADLFLNLLKSVDFKFEGLFTVIDEDKIRQRKY